MSQYAARFCGLGLWIHHFFKRSLPLVFSIFCYCFFSTSNVDNHLQLWWGAERRIFRLHFFCAKILNKVQMKFSCFWRWRNFKGSLYCKHVALMTNLLFLLFYFFVCLLYFEFLWKGEICTVCSVDRLLPDEMAKKLKWDVLQINTKSRAFDRTSRNAHEKSFPLYLTLSRVLCKVE